MDEREKELKKQDDKKFATALCAYLPYGVNCLAGEGKYSSLLSGANIGSCELFFLKGVGPAFGVDDIKPYLRSMKTMTEEEKDELYKVLKEETDIVIEQLKTGDCGIPEGKYHFNSQLQLDFCLRHKFDMFGLIPKGYALEAPEGMYNS